MGMEPSPWTFARDSRSRNGSRGNGTSYELSLFLVVRGTYKTKARGGSGSCLEMTTTGRVLAAIPRSANHTSPGWGLIEQVQNFLFGRTRAHQVENVVVGEIDDFGDALPDLRCSFRLPLPEFRVEFFRQGVHDIPPL